MGNTLLPTYPRGREVCAARNGKGEGMPVTPTMKELKEKRAGRQGNIPAGAKP